MIQKPEGSISRPDTKDQPHFRLASRGSMLALWQAHYVADKLKNTGATTEIIVMKTTGDRVQDRFLHEIGGKGLFVKELEQALLEQGADLAVHSLKDMPAQVKRPLILPAILERHSPYDLLILGKKLGDLLRRKHGEAVFFRPLTPETLQSLGSCTIATGSLRRQAMLARFAPKIQTTPIRGNVDTRLRKLDEGTWDGMILAEASLDRLQLKKDRATIRLDLDWFIPCASQGALAIETIADSPASLFTRAVLNHPETEAAVAVERRVLALLGGDCTMPFGCLVSPLAAGNTQPIGVGGASPQGSKVTDTTNYLMRAALYTPQGQHAEVTQTLLELPQTMTQDWVDAQAGSLVLGLKESGGPQILKKLNIPLPPGWL